MFQRKGAIAALNPELTCGDCLARQVLLEEAADFTFFGVTARFLLGVEQGTVHDELEQTATGRN